MGYTNSKLVDYRIISPNRNIGRTHSIDTITIHCVVGQAAADSLGYYFQNANLGASSNYGIGYDGKIGLYVEEKDRSWCSSSSSNDNRAITIEVASDTTHPYAVRDAAYKSLIKLVTDICKRNGIKALRWKADPSLIGQPDKQNMTVHRWFANKSCPGDYLYNRMGQIANEVNKALGSSVTSEVTKSESTSKSSVSIKTIQQWINKSYRYGLEEDNAYGYYTRTAITKALQTELNNKYGTKLIIDGIYGYNTNNAVRNVKLGDTGAIVRVLQAYLICNDYDTNGFDGIFGEATYKSVKSYQSNKNLFVDGIAGRNTFKKLATN